MNPLTIPRQKLDPEAERRAAEVTTIYIKALGRALPALEAQFLSGTSITVITDEGSQFQFRVGPPILNALGGMPLPSVGGKIIH